MSEISFTIAKVEKETGLSKDTLRMWERRYGFPSPERDAGGDRRYPVEQVDRLRHIKRLVDQGYRPGKLMTATTDELSALEPRRSPATTIQGEARNRKNLENTEISSLLSLLKAHDASAFQYGLQQGLARQGLAAFVRDTLAPLIRHVGEAWEDGRFTVFEEHLFTELAQRVLRQAIAGLPAGKQRPRVVLTSVPDESHGLGLLMVETLFALEGAECIPLGTQMPLLDIARAAEAHQADIVALSFSSAFPMRPIPGLLKQLSDLLPENVELWVGGAGMQRLTVADTNPRLKHLNSLEGGLKALAGWRQAHRDGSRTL